MRYAGIIYNDISAAPGVCISLYTQGCPFHCKGCHNPETWDFDGGYEFTPEVLKNLLDNIDANGVRRSLCILGGDPLHPSNLNLPATVILSAKAKYPDLKIYVWTGYIYEELLKRDDDNTKFILNNITALIDGPFIESKRDITLKMRGSSNQRIIELDKKENL